MTAGTVGGLHLLSPPIAIHGSSAGLRDLLTPSGMDERTPSGVIPELSSRQHTSAADRDASSDTQLIITHTSSPVDKQPTVPSALVKMYTDNLKSAAKASPASSAYDSFRRESSSQVEQLVRRIEATRMLGGGGGGGGSAAGGAIAVKGHSAARRESKLTCSAEKSVGSAVDPGLSSERDLRDADARSLDLLDADARSLDQDIVAHYQQEVDRQSQLISELKRRAESEGKLHQEELWSLRAELACLEKEIEVLRARALEETGVMDDVRDRPDCDLEEVEEEDRQAVRITERVSIETYAGPLIVRKELSLPAMKYTRRTSCSIYESGDEYAAISSLLSDYGSTVAQLKRVEQELVRQQQLVGELQRDKEVEASSARRSAALAARAVQRRVEVEQQLADALFHCEQLHRELTAGFFA